MKAANLNKIIIRLGAGTILDGFDNVTVELKSANVTQWEDRSILDPNPELQQLLNKWQLLYPAAIQMLSPDLNLSPVFDTDTVTNVSTQDMVDLNGNFRIAINNWLNFSNFGRIDRRIRTDLQISDRILVIIISEQLQIWQLPWHFWELFDDYPNAVEAFAKPRFINVRHIKPQPNGKVNILTLSGRDPILPLDLPFLNTLPQAYSHPLAPTSATEIADRLNKSQPWDILIFNGHGNTIEYQSMRDGVIYLDNDTPLEISRLKIEIQKAVDRGLQIAVFNCCNGLGLAEQLSDLNIPYIIVMREIVPNQCAQDFLQQLLTRYSQDESFLAAFKQARQSLRLSPGGFAQFADWLPILFHNPLSNEVTWQDLSATVFSSIIPTQLVTACRYLSQPNCRIWTTVTLSILLSSLFNLYSHPRLFAWEDAIVDRLQVAQVEHLTLSPSKVTIVNYDLMSTPGFLFNDDALRESIEWIETKAKPIAWAIDFKIGNDPTIFGNRIIQGCIDENLTSSRIEDRLQLDECERRLVEYLSKFGLYESGIQDFRLNPNLLIGTKSQIERVNLKEIGAQGSKSEAEIKELFDGKLVIVGDFDGKPSNRVARQAIAIDQIIRARDKLHPLPLLVSRSIGEQFLWIFAWSIFTGILVWYRHWKLLVPIAIVSEITIAGILFSSGQGLPIIVTPIAMILLAILIRSIMAIGCARIDRQLI